MENLFKVPRMAYHLRFKSFTNNLSTSEVFQQYIKFLVDSQFMVIRLLCASQLDYK